MIIIKKMRAIIFARVSQTSQADEGFSLPSQVKLLSDYADRNNFEVIEIISVPESASGTKERKIFNSLIKRLEADKATKSLIVEKVDRITRNSKDSVAIKDWINDDPERKIHLVKENVVLSKNSTSTEKFVWNIKVSTSELFIDNLKEEVNKGTLEKAQQGWYPGSKKIGYKSTGEHGHKTWVVDLQEADLIKKTFELCAFEGYSLETLRYKLSELGYKRNGREIRKNYLNTILKDSMYCGEFDWNGIHYYEGKHEPIVSKEIFQIVQDRLAGRNPGKIKIHDFLFGKGLIKCKGCGRSLVGETHKGFIYYHCNKYQNKCNFRKYIREEEIEKQIIVRLGELEFKNPRLLEWVKKAVKESLDNDSALDRNISAQQSTRVSNLKRRRQVLFDEFADKKITRDLYDTQLAGYEQEISAILEQQKFQAKIDHDTYQLAANIVELASKAKNLYLSKIPNSDKRKLLNFVLSNFLMDGEKIDIAYRKSYEILANWPITAEFQPGAGDGIRTRDLLLGKETLYH